MRAYHAANGDQAAAVLVINRETTSIPKNFGKALKSRVCPHNAEFLGSESQGILPI
jgi:hypothetical protein